MISRTPWLERHFASDLPVSMFPFVLERLRGTPARLEDRLLPVAPGLLAKRIEGAWSILETVGHLILVEALWMARLDDFEAARSELRAAAFDRAPVDTGRFNDRPLDGLLREFRQARSHLVTRLEWMDRASLERVAHHPRLHQPMSVVGLMAFAAEHDDHHLAGISELIGVGRSTDRGSTGASL